MDKIAIGIDLGGTRIKAVALNSSYQIIQQLYTPTNDGDELHWKNAVAHSVKQLENICAAHASSVGISAPGISNESNSAITCMPGRLQGLENFIWSDWLGKKAWVLNDALSALLAEARMGNAKNKKHVALLTLGTGVGGALLIDGKPYQGAFHKAGHLGHMVIDYSAAPDVTGMPGSLEDAIGNCTIEIRSEGKFKSTHELLDAFRNGDESAKQIWLLSVRKLAIGIASIANICSPETVILGGGITEAGQELFEPLEQYLQLYEWRPNGHRINIIKAALGDMAGAIGAACFAMEK